MKRRVEAAPWIEWRRLTITPLALVVDVSTLHDCLGITSEYLKVRSSADVGIIVFPTNCAPIELTCHGVASLGAFDRGHLARPL